MSRRPARPCPRTGCPNSLSDPAQIICVGDFHMLAGVCRGKSPLCAPVAAMVEAGGGGVVYHCPLCRQHHNGRAVRNREELAVAALAAANALRADARVGPQGLLNLIAAWAPERSRRRRWAASLDQTLAYAQPAIHTSHLRIDTRG